MAVKNMGFLESKSAPLVVHTYNDSFGSNGMSCEFIRTDFNFLNSMQINEDVNLLRQKLKSLKGSCVKAVVMPG